MEKTEDLREIELDAILKFSNDNIVITDGDGLVLRANPNCLSIYGKEASSIIGKSVERLEKEGIFSPSVTLRVLKERKEVQVMQHTKQGRIVMATGVPVFGDDGEIIRVISFSHDLTELEHLKEDYEKLRTRMERYQSEIEELREKDAPAEIICESKPIMRTWDMIHRVAKSDATVVFLGESGVGKTMFARILHNNSERKKETFIEVNCSAIPESLFESEMFGYEAGSFTGANKNGKPGLIELADGGTLYLDEIGELPLSVQAKLLKVLQEKSVTRVGSVNARTIDFRLIASTNQDLEAMVKKGTFREDLYYRLNVIPIRIPPLRERPDDIVKLAYHQLQKVNEKYACDKFFHASAIEELIAYSWPGNVRELENMVERLVITTETRIIYPHQLPFYADRHREAVEEFGENDVIESERATTLKEALEEVEKRWLLRAYRQCKTTYEMAEYLGISQPSVVRRLQKYKIDSEMN